MPRRLRPLLGPLLATVLLVGAALLGGGPAASAAPTSPGVPAGGYG